jgi:alpha-1,2-mannosyltransferase
VGRGRVAVLTAVRAGRRSTVVKVLVVLAFLAAVWEFLALTADRHGYFDLRVYDGAMNYWIHGGGQLYDYLLPKTEYGFTYPTFAALLMVPMAFLSWHMTIAISLSMTLAVTFVMIYWFIAPIVRRQGWSMWFSFAITVGLFAAFEPLHETVSFGQVNLLLLFLATADLLLLIVPGRRLGGIGIGLATAIKLTPGIFIVYLLVTRRWRAAAVASATAGAATWLAATVAPDASRTFWTDALWNTDRVGSTAFVSNQSLMGIVSRLNPTEPNKLLWAALVLGAMVVWAIRARRAVRAGDEMAGLALTGIVGCLVSPITWIHHLVWALPAFVLLADHAVDKSWGGKRERRNMLIFAIITYGILCSRLPWAFHNRFHDFGLLGSNAYVLVLIILLFTLPIRVVTPAAGAVGGSAEPTGEDVPDLAEIDRKVTAAFDAKDAATDPGQLVGSVVPRR